MVQFNHATESLLNSSEILKKELHNYRSAHFPKMLEDARERANNNPDSDYETKRLAYWRQQNFNLKKLQGDNTGNNKKAGTPATGRNENGSCKGVFNQSFQGC